MRFATLIGGLAIGCGLGVASYAVLHDGEAPVAVESVAPAIQPPTTTAPPWVAAGEIRFESTVLLPHTPSVENGAVTLEYELVNLAAPSTEVAALPELWRLATTAGEYSAETRHGTRRVRFEVPAALVSDDVDEVRLVGWRSVLPIDFVFTIPATVGEHAVLPDGATITVRSALEQASGTLVTFDTTRSLDDFSAGSPNQFLLPTADSGWRAAWGDSFQVAADNAAPPTIELRYTKPLWLPTVGELIVWTKP